MQDELDDLEGQAAMRTLTAETGGPSNQSDLDRMAMLASQIYYEDKSEGLGSGSGKGRGRGRGLGRGRGGRGRGGERRGGVGGERRCGNCQRT